MDAPAQQDICQLTGIDSTALITKGVRRSPPVTQANVRSQPVVERTRQLNVQYTLRSEGSWEEGRKRAGLSRGSTRACAMPGPLQTCHLCEQLEIHIVRLWRGAMLLLVSPPGFQIDTLETHHRTSTTRREAGNLRQQEAQCMAP